MSHPAQLAIDTLHAARRWVAARLVLRRMLDSKSAAPQQVEKAKVDYNKTAEELEGAVVRLERAMRQNGSKLPFKKGAALFPWKEFIGMVSTGAQALQSALEPDKPTKATVVSSKVIDAEIE